MTWPRWKRQPGRWNQRRRTSARNWWRGARFPLTSRSPYSPWNELAQSLAAVPGIHLGHITHRQCSADRGKPSRRRLPPAVRSENSTFHVPPTYAGRIEHLVEDSLRFKSERQRVVIVSKQAQRLSDLFAEQGEHLAPVDSCAEMPAAGSLTLVQGSLAEGWVLDEQTATCAAACALAPAITLLSDAEIFGWARPKRRSFTRKKAASPESFFAELHVGDYVVHIDHGIGIYRGLVHKAVDRHLPQAGTEYLPRGVRSPRVPGTGVRRGRPGLCAGQPDGSHDSLRGRQRPHRQPCTVWVRPTGSWSRSRAKRPCRRSPANCWISTPRAKSRPATPLRPTRPGSRSWRPPSPTRRPKTSCAPSTR